MRTFSGRVVLLLKYSQTCTCSINTGRSTQGRFPPKYIGVVFLAIHSTLTSLEMHSKGRYKNCTCSVILGELESFRNYKGFSIILQKILDAT